MLSLPGQTLRKPPLPHPRGGRAFFFWDEGGRAGVQNGPHTRGSLRSKRIVLAIASFPEPYLLRRGNLIERVAPFLASRRYGAPVRVVHEQWGQCLGAWWVCRSLAAACFTAHVRQGPLRSYALSPMSPISPLSPKTLQPKNPNTLKTSNPQTPQP